MEIEDLLEEAKLWDIPEGQRQQVEVLELEEYLDNLGYIDIRQNELTEEINATDILDGIREFRAEYERFYLFSQEHSERYQQAYPKAFQHVSPPVDQERAAKNELTEEELNFLAHLSSLEGAFELHRFAKPHIKAQPILTRVLNFRLSILGLSDEHLRSAYSSAADNALGKLKRWAEANTYTRQLELSGDVHQLADILAHRTEYPGSKYAHIIYFEDEAVLKTKAKEAFEGKEQKTTAFRRKKGEGRKKRQDFTVYLGHIPEASRKKYNAANKKKEFDAIMQDELHRHMCRVAQVKLWLLGTYDGPLDNDIGPVNPEAIIGLIELIQRLQGEITGGVGTGGIFIEDLIASKRGHYWAFNVTFLFKAVFPILIDKYADEVKSLQEGDEQEDDIEHATVAEEVHNLSQQVAENERDDFYNELNALVKEDDRPEKRRRKVKTRGSKDFFRSVKVFFKKLANDIGKMIIRGVKAIVAAIRKLFEWIKNGIKVLIREIKKAFTLFRKAVRFVFGKKIIRTRTEKTAIITDYSLDFDNTTKLTGTDAEALAVHIQKNREITLAMQATANFLGVALYICANIGKGPAGWLKMGVRLIKHLAQRKFGYQRFSFPVFV